MNLANSLVRAGHKVVLWSSAFYHQKRRHRSGSYQRIMVSPRLEIRLIASPGYERNIGVGRLWDHLILALNLKQQLKEETSLPDVAFIGYPPIEIVAVMTHWLAVRGVPSILDIKDQWPMLFLKAFPKALRTVGRVALLPYFHFARQAMREATGLSAMADDFLKWAISFSGRLRNENDLVVPLTSPTGQVSNVELDTARQWWDDKGITNDRPRVCFVGNNVSVLDCNPVCEAARYFAAHGSQVEFVICGDSESSSAWQSLLSGLPNVYFPGWID